MFLLTRQIPLKRVPMVLGETLNAVMLPSGLTQVSTHNPAVRDWLVQDGWQEVKPPEKPQKAPSKKPA